MTSKPMAEKICLVTGATAGIGKITAQNLAEQGAKVIIVSRNKEKCASTVQEIKQLTANNEVNFIAADLTSQKEIHNLAKQFADIYPRLDILVNNAGGLFLSRQLSIDGIEMTWALNHLNYFLLTNLLIDSLQSKSSG